MNLEKIELSWQQAFVEGQKYVEPTYRSEKDHLTALIYAGVMQGRHLISLSTVFQKAGWTRHNYPLPKLAIGWLNSRVIRVTLADGKLVFGGYESQSEATGSRGSKLPYIKVPTDHHGYVNATAPVPPVPPTYRPTDKLDAYAILWEAKWEPIPPVDPALLRHYAGDVWEVMATWDLTEVERMALAE